MKLNEKQKQNLALSHLPTMSVVSCFSIETDLYVIAQDKNKKVIMWFSHKHTHAHARWRHIKMTVESARRFPQWRRLCRVAALEAGQRSYKTVIKPVLASGLNKHCVEVTHMAEAALVRAVCCSARMLAVLRLGFDVILLKPTQNKVPEEPGQQQNTGRL